MTEEFKGFLKEARTTRLHHPHIVLYPDLVTSRENLPYPLMEYAQNGVLRD